MVIIKDFLKAFVLGIAIFIVILLVNKFQGYALGWGSLVEKFLVNQLYSMSLYLANTYVFRYYQKRYKHVLYTIKHLPYSIFGGIVTTVGTIFLVRLVLIVLIYDQTLVHFIQNERPKYYVFSFLISVVVTGIYYGLYYWKHRQETRVKVSEIKAGTANAQFDALKNQLDPHFLFNSLNVLTSLIEENPVQAQSFTTALSKIYRYVLEQKNKQLVTVDEELKFARTYMRLIKMRFEDSISVVIPEAVSNPEARVVPLSLQLLLENAVKHNIVTPSRKLEIEIYEEGGNLFVQNNIQPKKVLKKSSGVGLQNIKLRYHLLTERVPLIYQDDKHFKVGIPMLTRQISRDFSRQHSFLQDKQYERAKEKFKSIRDFYIHLAIYLFMVPVFIYINSKNTAFIWAIFPIVGWGLGVLANAAEVFEWSFFLGKKWSEKKIKEYMDKESE